MMDIKIFSIARSNHDAVINEVFGSSKDDFPDVLLENFINTRNDINANFFEVRR